MIETSNRETTDTSFPFHAIYFMDATSGLTYLGQNYSGQEFNEDLMSGMLKALECFINHLSYANQYDRIQEINFQGSRIVYERLGSVMAVGISKKINEDHEHNLLKYLLSEFLEQYGSYIPNEGGNVAPFQPFRQRLQMFEQEAVKNIYQISSSVHRTMPFNSSLPNM
jgi:hypothetical protein